MIPHLVIGGGLAGAAVATLLARRGESVTLLEREKELKHKVCGEFLSIEAQHYLGALGVDLDRLAAPAIRTVRVASGLREIEAHLPFLGRSLTRRRLDDAVLKQAQRSGAIIRRGAQVAALTSQYDGFHLRLAGGDCLTARHVYLATGKHELRGHVRSWQKPRSLGFKMLWRLSPEQQRSLTGRVELYLFSEGYAGLEPVENGLANLCMAISAQDFALNGRSWKALLNQWKCQSPLLAERLHGAEAVLNAPLAVAGVPYGFVHRATLEDHPLLYRLGDQMAVIPSFCGDGMAMALHSAFLAAHAFDARQYHRQAREDFLPLMRRACILERFSSHRIGRHLLMLGGRFTAPLLPMLAARTRLSREQLVVT